MKGCRSTQTLSMSMQEKLTEQNRKRDSLSSTSLSLCVGILGKHVTLLVHHPGKATQVSSPGPFKEGIIEQNVSNEHHFLLPSRERCWLVVFVQLSRPSEMERSVEPPPKIKHQNQQFTLTWASEAGKLWARDRFSECKLLACEHTDGMLKKNILSFPWTGGLRLRQEAHIYKQWLPSQAIPQPQPWHSLP